MLSRFLKLKRFLALTLLAGIAGIFAIDINAEEPGDSVFANFETNGEKAGYCFYSESVNVQIAATGSDPMEALPLLQTVQEWQSVMDTLLPDRDARNQRMAGVLMEFNRRQGEYNDLTPEEAKRKLVKHNETACNELLAHFKTIDLKPETVRDTQTLEANAEAAQQVETDTPQVKPWFEQVDYAGTWKTTRVMRKFPYAKTVMLELWKDVDGKPRGIGLFVGDGSECPGELTLHEQELLAFKPVDSPACAKVKPGLFKITKIYGRQAMMFLFIPQGEKQNPQIMATNMASYSRQSQTPATLQAFATAARNGNGSVYENLQAAHEKALEEKARLLAQQDNSGQVPKIKLSIPPPSKEASGQKEPAAKSKKPTPDPNRFDMLKSPPTMVGLNLIGEHGAVTTFNGKNSLLYMHVVLADKLGAEMGEKPGSFVGKATYDSRTGTFIY